MTDLSQVVMINILFYRSISEDGRNIGKARLWQRQARSEGHFSLKWSPSSSLSVVKATNHLSEWHDDDIDDMGMTLVMMVMI